MNSKQKIVLCFGDFDKMKNGDIFWPNALIYIRLYVYCYFVQVSIIKFWCDFQSWSSKATVLVIFQPSLHYWSLCVCVCTFVSPFLLKILVMWWHTCSWRPCWQTAIFSYLMWEIQMNTRLDALQMLSTCHVSCKCKLTTCLSCLYGLSYSLCVCWCEHQWTTWRSL